MVAVVTQFYVGETVLLQPSFTKGTITWTHHLNRHWRSVEIKKAGFSDDVDDLRIIELRYGMVFVVQLLICVNFVDDVHIIHAK